MAINTQSYKILTDCLLNNGRDAIEAVALDESLVTWANAQHALESEKVIHKDC